MKIAMIGRGGHSKVISEMIRTNENYQIVAYLDDKYENVILMENIFCGPISSINKLLKYDPNIKFIIAIGNNKTRKLIVEKLNLTNEYYVTIIHKSSIISNCSKIGNGTVIMPGSVINADAEIGDHSIINTGAVIEHDCVIGNFTHVCPGATLTGTVNVELGAFVGAGATVIPNIRVGEWATIGAGATVIQNVPSYCTAVGNPAKVVNNNLSLKVN
ncbi:acetyltransferase [Neobacillus niacini]|uniref:acetyltransferase n=1 Tax=Neobacillus niacini TaxID=86668 RepID=UPI002859855D|nr:acetyltransferase [Neobacillus niacini]MDR7000607.1 acetyltransferase EpsM [Neobacillus niacini]